MLMFREEKSPDDEIKAWQFWHGRQHSVKQRILDAGKSCIVIIFSTQTGRRRIGNATARAYTRFNGKKKIKIKKPRKFPLVYFFTFL